MNEPASERALDLFSEWCELEAAERTARLDELRRADPSLAAQVERLFAADQREHTLLDADLEPARLAALLARADGGVDADAALPESIGPFRIVRMIGEGGMGVVFEAEQDFPRRRVALKVLRASVGAGERSARFRREIALLARLEHPGIARIHEAGVTPDGLAYFTMELVRGRPLGEHVAATRPSLAERIDLVARLCDAVEHAHARGVVHRDLKPGNVLVDEDGAPRVLDFGIASAAAEDGEDTQLRTQAGVLLGTIGYMSPEQASADGRRIDARSDVYSIGVMLYEVLGGAPPHALRGRPLHEAVRAVCVEDPPPLSSLDRRLAGDLETIVHKALEKEPERRYASTAALAADLRRVLADEPIVARPATTFYRLGKFARRHRGLVAAVLAVFATLVAGIAAALWQARRATRSSEEARAQTHAAELQGYLAATQGAEAALAVGDVETARRLLDGAPEARRGWEWEHLTARLDVCTALLAFDAEVLDVAFGGDASSPEVVVFDERGVLSRWTLDLSRELGRTAFEGGPFAHAGFSDDLSAVVTATADGQVVVHGLDGASRALDGRYSGILRLHVARGGAATAVVGGRATVGYQLADGTRLPIELDVGLTSALFDDAGTSLLVGTALGAVIVADAAGGTRTLHQGDPADVRCIARSADGARLALGHIDRRVFVVDRTSGETRGPFTGNSGSLHDVALSADARWLATAGGDGLVRLWDLARGTSPAAFPGHRGTAKRVVISPDGELLLTCGADRTVRVWRRGDDGAARVLAGHASWVYGVAFSPDGERLYSGAWDGDVRAWSGTHGGEPRVLAHVADRAVLSLAAAPNAPLLAVGRVREEILLVDADTGAVLTELPVPAPRSAEALAFDGSGALLASFSYHGFYSPNRGRVDLFDVASRERIHGWSIHSLGFGGIAFSPDGRDLYVATTSRVHAFDVVSREPRVTVVAPDGACGIAVAPDGREFATGHDAGLIVVRDPRTLEPRRELHGHHGRVYALAYTRDGSRLFSGARDGQILVWDTATGLCVGRLTGHENYVYALAFAPDGSRVASASGDGTVRLWDTVPRRER